MKSIYGSKMAASFALVALLVIASPLTAVAHEGHDHGNTTNSSQSSQTEQGSDDSADGSDTVLLAAQDSTGTSKSERADGSLHDRSQKLLKEKRQERKNRTEAQRQEACRQHAADIDQRFDALGGKAGRYLNGFNTIFTKVQAYQTKNQLDVANYDALVADVTAKQAAATAAVAALKTQSETKINCGTSDPASSVAVVKTAAQDAHTAMKAYRTSLKTLVKALQAAKQNANTAQSKATSEDN